jgi:fructokinase
MIKAASGAQPRVVCIGELLVDLCAVDADTPLRGVSTFVRAPGGAPANVAVGTARLGCHSAFVGAVGSDFFGSFLIDVLKNEQVDTSHISATPAARTTLAFIANHTNDKKEVEFYRNPGADMYLSAANVPESYIGGFDVVHFGSISLLDAEPRLATLKARDAGIRRGALTSYDVNWRPALWPDVAEARRQLRAGAEGVAVLKMSDEDWAGILNDDDFLESAHEFFDAGVELVIRTEGAAGARFATRRYSSVVPAFNVTTVDCLGAGDAFMAALISALGQHRLREQRPGDLSKDELTKAVRYANAAAAVSTRLKGGMPSLPTSRLIDRFLKSSGPR